MEMTMTTRHLVVTNGDDPLTAPIVDYLVRTYALAKTDIKRVQLDSQVGDVQTITVTLMVREG
jgi:hypothetical protein